MGQRQCVLGFTETKKKVKQCVLGFTETQQGQSVHGFTETKHEEQSVLGSLKQNKKISL